MPPFHQTPKHHTNGLFYPALTGLTMMFESRQKCNVISLIPSFPPSPNSLTTQVAYLLCLGNAPSITDLWEYLYLGQIYKYTGVINNWLVRIPLRTNICTNKQAPSITNFWEYFYFGQIFPLGRQHLESGKAEIVINMENLHWRLQIIRKCHIFKSHTCMYLTCLFIWRVTLRRALRPCDPRNSAMQWLDSALDRG